MIDSFRYDHLPVMRVLNLISDVDQVESSVPQEQTLSDVGRRLSYTLRADFWSRNPRKVHRLSCMHHEGKRLRSAFVERSNVERNLSSTSCRDISRDVKLPSPSKIVVH